jgi:hypothetical protein
MAVDDALSIATGRGDGESKDILIRFTVTFTPSGFERFFPDIERLGLVITDVSELTSVAGDAGMEILGPPLNDEEVRQIIAEVGAS